MGVQVDLPLEIADVEAPDVVADESQRDNQRNQAVSVVIDES